MKRVPRESGGTAEANSSRPNGQGATLLEPPLPQHGEALGTILAALQTMQNGDFSVRLPVAWSGLEGKIADTLFWRQSAVDPPELFTAPTIH